LHAFQLGAEFIVDEIQTGCGATGTMWAHETWDLPEPPDYVTFAKKFQAAGFFHKAGLRPKQPLRIFNTWMGDQVRMVVMDAVIKEIFKESLLDYVVESGRTLLTGLKELENRYPSLLHSARGAGTFCAVDCYDLETREKLISNLRNRGFHVGVCGDLAIRFRPALIFQSHHAYIFLEGLEATLRDF